MSTKNTKQMIKEIDVVAPSMGRRFSGINASMYAVIPEQKNLTNIVGMGFHLDGGDFPRISFRQFIFCCWRDKWRVWHARRNMDMLVGIVLKYVFRYKLVLVFTSASQRKHSWLTKFYYHKMDGVIATTNSGGKFLECDYTVVYHGVNTAKFYPEENKDSIVKIGFLSRIRKQKGAEDFVDAVIEVLSKYDSCIAYLYGEITVDNKAFDTELKLRVKNAGLQDRVLFEGFVDYDKTPECYRDFDIVVCASHVEGFGLPCLEAMATKCAVIATKTGVWKEIIKDGENGFLVDCKSPTQIANKIDLLVSNDKLRKYMATNGYKLVTTNYKIANEAEGIQAVYDKVLEGRNQ